jgi:hypothetical protein
MLRTLFFSTFFFFLVPETKLLRLYIFAILTSIPQTLVVEELTRKLRMQFLVQHQGYFVASASQIAV